VRVNLILHNYYTTQNIRNAHETNNKETRVAEPEWRSQRDGARVAEPDRVSAASDFLVSLMSVHLFAFYVYFRDH